MDRRPDKYPSRKTLEYLVREYRTSCADSWGSAELNQNSER